MGDHAKISNPKVGLASENAGEVVQGSASTSGVVLDWPADPLLGNKWARIRVRGRSAFVRLQRSAEADALLVITEADYNLEHGAISGGDSDWDVGNFLRGTVTGAVAKVVEIVDTTNVRVTMVFGVLTASDVLTETTDGYAGGDTGATASTTSVTKEVNIDEKIRHTEEWLILFNPNPASYSKVAVRTAEGTSAIELIPAVT